MHWNESKDLQYVEGFIAVATGTALARERAVRMAWPQ